MKVSKAIEILSLSLKSGETALRSDFKLSMLLGIEALKHIQWLHESHVLHYNELLPGETPTDE